MTGASIAKNFSPASIVSGGISTMTLGINNYNYSPLTPINSHRLDADYGEWRDDGSADAERVDNVRRHADGRGWPSNVQFSGGSFAVVAATATSPLTCTITVDVVGTNTATTAINLTNSIPAGTFGGVSYSGVSRVLTVVPNQPLYGSNQGRRQRILRRRAHRYAGTIRALTVTLNNTTTVPVTVTSLTDDLTTMGTGFTVAASPAPSTTCAGGTVNAPAGGTLITMAGGTIPAGNGTTSGSCTVPVRHSRFD